MYESLFKNPLHRVFVYGTLKRGEPNHRVIQNATDGYAKFLGLGKTVNKYPLVIATKYNIPFLLKKPGTGNQILGEVYDVDTKMLAKLDELEEHPSFYVRTEEDVLLAPTANLKPDINFEEGRHGLTSSENLIKNGVSSAVLLSTKIEMHYLRCYYVSVGRSIGDRYRGKCTCLESLPRHLILRGILPISGFLLMGQYSKSSLCGS